MPQKASDVKMFVKAPAPPVQAFGLVSARGHQGSWLSSHRLPSNGPLNRSVQGEAAHAHLSDSTQQGPCSEKGNPWAPRPHMGITCSPGLSSKEHSRWGEWGNPNGGLPLPFLDMGHRPYLINPALMAPGERENQERWKATPPARVACVRLSLHRPAKAWSCPVIG